MSSREFFTDWMVSNTQNADLILHNGCVVMDDYVCRADVIVKNGRIIGIVAPGAKIDAAQHKDCSGLHIFPGLIDPHAHYWEPGPMNFREDYYHATRASAAAGVTTVLEMPLSVPPVKDEDSFLTKLHVAEKNSVIDFGFWGALIPDSIKNLKKLNALGCVAYKGFISFANPDYPHVTDDYLYDAFEEAAEFNGLIGVHAENAYLAKSLCEKMDSKGVTEPWKYHEGRPPLVEAEAIDRVIRISYACSASVYICHMSAAEGVEIAHQARSDGKRVFTETCPHYLLFDNMVMKEKGVFAKCNPPIRSAENKDRLWEMVLRGDIDCLGSDHGPYSDEDKLSETNIWRALPGFGGVWGLLPVMLTEGYHKRGLSLPRIARITSGNAADIFGLPGKGSIRVGNDADFCIVDINADWAYDGDRSFTKLHTKNNIFEGVPLKGKIVSTFVRGTEVYGNDTILVDSGYGKLVRRCVKD